MWKTHCSYCKCLIAVVAAKGGTTSNQVWGLFFPTGSGRFGSLLSLHKWNHHLKTAFCIFSGYLCLILKCVWWSETCQCDKKAKTKGICNRRQILFHSTVFSSAVFCLLHMQISWKPVELRNQQRLPSWTSVIVWTRMKRSFCFCLVDLAMKMKMMKVMMMMMMMMKMTSPPLEHLSQQQVSRLANNHKSKDDTHRNENDYRRVKIHFWVLELVTDSLTDTSMSLKLIYMKVYYSKYFVKLNVFTVCEQDINWVGLSLSLPSAGQTLNWTHTVTKCN